MKFFQYDTYVSFTLLVIGKNEGSSGEMNHFYALSRFVFPILCILYMYELYSM